MHKILTEWRKYLTEQESVAGDPATALVEKYWAIVTGKKMKPSREELIQLQKIGKKNDSAAKILAQYYKPINQNMYSYWRKHYEKLSKTSLGRGKVHAIAKRMDYTFAQPEMQQALIDALSLGLTVAAVIMIASGVGAPAGVALQAATKAALRQGFKQAVRAGGKKAAEQGLKKAAIHTGKHIAKEKAAWGATETGLKSAGVGVA